MQTRKEEEHKECFNKVGPSRMKKGKEEEIRAASLTTRPLYQGELWDL